MSEAENHPPASSVTALRIPIIKKAVLLDKVLLDDKSEIITKGLAANDDNAMEEIDIRWQTIDLGQEDLSFDWSEEADKSHQLLLTLMLQAQPIHLTQRKGLQSIPPPTGAINPPRADVAFYLNTVKSNTNRNKVIIEDWVDSDDEEVPPVRFSEIRSIHFETRNSSETNHLGVRIVLVKDQGEGDLGTEMGSRDSRSVWNNTRRVNHRNFTSDYRHPHQRRSFIPSAVLTREGLKSTIRSKMSQAVPSQSTASAFYQSTARPNVSKAVLLQSTARPYFPRPVFSTSTGRPYYPRMYNVRPRASSSSPPTGFFNTRTVDRPKSPKPIIKSKWVKKESTAGTQAVLPQTKGEKGSVVTSPKQTWRSKGAYLDHRHKNNGSYTLKKFEYSNPEEELKDHAIIDSGCSGSMTGDKDKLSDFKEYKGGYVAFGNDPKGGRITGKGTIKTSCIDFENVSYVKELKFNLLSVSQICDKKHNCAKASEDELFCGTEDWVTVNSEYHKLGLRAIWKEFFIGNPLIMKIKDTEEEIDLESQPIWITPIDVSVFFNTPDFIKIIRRKSRSLVLLLQELKQENSCKRLMPPKGVYDSSLGELTFILGLQKITSVDVNSWRMIGLLACKKQTICKLSHLLKSEYVAAASCCDNEEYHMHCEDHVSISKTKHIQIEASLLRDCYDQRLINVVKIMAITNSCSKHNMIACVEKTERNAAFHEERRINEVAHIEAKDTLLHCLSSKSTSWNQFGINIASALVGLATNQKFNFSKLIFDGMLRNLKDSKPFLMCPRFIQLFLNKQLEGSTKPQNFLPTVVLPPKVFTFMSKCSPKFYGKLTPLTPPMLEVATAVRAEHSVHAEEFDITSSSYHSDDSSAGKKAESPSPVASERPASPNDYTPTDEVQTSGGDEGNLDLYGLTREVPKLKKQNDKQAAQILRLKTKIKILVKKVKPVIAEYSSFVKLKATLEEDDSDGSAGLNEVDVNSGDSQMMDVDDTISVEVHEGTTQVNEGTAQVNEGTAEVNEGTAQVNEGTAEVNESTVGANLSSEPLMKEVEDEAGPSTFQDEFDEFIQDDTLIADTLVDITRPRRGAGITIPGNIPEQERLESPTLILDPKDKGKGIMKEEPKKKKLTLQQLRAAKTANDEEVARKDYEMIAAEVQRTERENFTEEQKTKFLVETIAAQRRFRVEQQAAFRRSKPPTIPQLRKFR
ncbi:hypothetical protein Tco_1570273 [Tanacetum coccineum]